MKVLKPSKIIFLVCCVAFLSFNSLLHSEELLHVGQLFNLRDAITEQGNLLPEKIEKTSGNDRRTLERIFELNTSTLTTIEAYFRILMITIANENETNSETVKILNEWLTFTKNQCVYDIEYLNATLKETKDPQVLDEIIQAKKHAEYLLTLTTFAVTENSKLLNRNAV
ncbi:MAG: hypothetical protein ABIH85_04385 [Candidatus Omnitrophota bacterium]|nr:hypothetical protein [Candidatus Omnitrophota bacterium]